MLNLGFNQNTNIIQKTNLSDVLTAELEFNEAYQAFINYRNTCEIVVKAQASVERMEFAKELLGTPVANVHISKEAFTTSLKRAWQKFVGWIKQAFSYIKYNILKYTFKKDGEFSITVDESREKLKKCIETLSFVVKAIDDKKSDDEIADKIAEYNRLNSKETITTRKDLVEFLRLAEKTVYHMNIAANDAKSYHAGFFSNIITMRMEALKKDITAIIAAAKKTKENKESEGTTNNEPEKPADQA